jgi:ABC-type lipopolysaccharide export system ATPase subunit
MKNILEVDSVILEFEFKRVLQNVYLKSETGKVTGILGRNGSGKSCLMKIIYGELVPNDKSLPQAGFVPYSMTIKRIFNDFELDFADLTRSFPEFKKLYKTKLKNLSGGERRIIEIFIILVSKTKFCMLDEPFSYVMPIHVDALKNLILREKENKGIIITDHLYEHIIDICDNLYVINDGKTYLTNSIQDIETLGYARIR